ncbi:Maf family protein [Teredinibacter waterburyi]|uniref:Maf family protein n=1 Tax=Teredinibacter waterburyi TaxID=1500538 RepID=UPI00165FF1B6|nr:Maf family nucleotide pyrophosphatase [Teredinibacter waterburyi]
MKQQTPKIILASSSPYRKLQLEQLGISFSCEPADIDETPRPNETCGVLAQRLSRDKALEIAKRPEHANCIIIGSDQTAECDGMQLSKPGTTDRAIAQLCHSQGKEVTFHTGLCVLRTPELQTHDDANTQMLCDVIQTRVRFRALTLWQIHRYIELENPLDCAGSFKCEGLGISLFESICSDDPSALIGLPLIALNLFLFQLGLDLLN